MFKGRLRQRGLHLRGSVLVLFLLVLVSCQRLHAYLSRVFVIFLAGRVSEIDVCVYLYICAHTCARACLFVCNRFLIIHSALWVDKEAVGQSASRQKNFHGSLPPDLPQTSFEANAHIIAVMAEGEQKPRGKTQKLWKLNFATLRALTQSSSDRNTDNLTPIKARSFRSNCLGHP